MVDARTDFDRVLQVGPQNSGALTGIERVEVAQKHCDKAADDFQRSIAADSSQRDAHYYLGITYARLGRKADSEMELPIAGDREKEGVARRRAAPRRRLLIPDIVRWPLLAAKLSFQIGN